MAIPVAMLYVNGIMIMVRKAGTATSNLSQAILPSGATISAPTMISAGAVTFDVTTDRSGEKNVASKREYLLQLPQILNGHPQRHLSLIQRKKLL